MFAELWGANYAINKKQEKLYFINHILLDAGANIDAVTGNEKIFGMSMGGITPAMTAADIARFDIVYELLKLGADYQFKDDSGRNLMSRVTAMNGRFPAGSEQEKALKRVIVWLSEL